MTEAHSHGAAQLPHAGYTHAQLRTSLQEGQQVCKDAHTHTRTPVSRSIYLTYIYIYTYIHIYIYIYI